MDESHKKSEYLSQKRKGAKYEANNFENFASRALAG